MRNWQTIALTELLRSCYVASTVLRITYSQLIFSFSQRDIDLTGTLKSILELEFLQRPTYMKIVVHRAMMADITY